MSLNQEDKIKYLAKVAIFEGITGMELSHIAEHVEEINFAKNATIFKEGDCADCLFLLIKGRVKITKGADQDNIVGVLKEGDAFGELALFDEQPRSATITAIEEVTALLLRRDDFRGLIKKMPEIALPLLKLMARRLRVTTNVSTMLQA